MAVGKIIKDLKDKVSHQKLLIEKLMLEHSCLIDYIQMGGENESESLTEQIEESEILLNKLKEKGYKSFPGWEQQTYEDRIYVQKLNELEI